MRATYVDHMGDDLLVVNSARVSFSKESNEFTYREDNPNGSDEGLVSYLASHNHWTPFSHPQICMREKVPIFVARQRFKHMVGFTYNEVSRRYVDDTPEFFRPSIWRNRPNGNMKQGSGHEEVFGMHSVAERAIQQCKLAYENMLELGVAPEQARMVLPQSMYTEYFVTGSLAAWARAYKQRIDPHAQKEIQDLAVQWGEIIEPLFPESWKVLIKDAS